MASAPNTDQLANDARCIDKCIPDGEKLAVLISLLYQLQQQGGTGGGGTSVLPSGDIFVGNAANVATAVAMSQDATIDNTGAVTLANNATARSDLGLGTANAVQFLSVLAQWFQETEVAIPAVNIDWSAGGIFTKTIAAATVFTFSNVTAGRVIKVVITGDASHTVTWPAVVWPGGVAPTQTLSKVDVYTFLVANGGTIYGSAVQNMS